MISIVDDDPDVRAATANLVRSLGFAAENFASAEDFLESDRVDDTACLIADVRLPGLSGIGLQVRLRAEGRKVPVILMTAFPEEHVKSLALAAGAVALLSKPYDAQSLADFLHNVLRARPS